MITLREILITAWLILLMIVVLRRVDGAPQTVQSSEPINQVQVMQVVDRP